MSSLIEFWIFTNIFEFSTNHNTGCLGSIFHSKTKPFGPLVGKVKMRLRTVVQIFKIFVNKQLEMLTKIYFLHIQCKNSKHILALSTTLSFWDISCQRMKNRTRTPCKVEIQEFFCHSFLREIKFDRFWVSEICNFEIVKNDTFGIF